MATVGGWLRAVVCGTSIVVIAWYSAALVVRTAWPEADGPAAVEDAGAGPRVSESVRGSRSRQSFAPVFGVKAVSASLPEAVPVATNTTYALRGLFEASDGRGIALIESSRVTAAYGERDRLPGGETVAEIGADSVTLSGASGLTRIAFESTVLPGAVPSQRPVTPDREAVGGGATVVYRAPPDIRPEQRPPISQARLTDHVLSPEVMAATRFARVRSGNGMYGLRVQSRPPDELTHATGLHRGDIILAVNGVSIDGADTVRATLLEMAPTRRDVVIDLVRRDAPYRLVIPLAHG